MTSLARLGPVSTPALWPGATSATTSVMRFSDPCSTPLVRLTRAAPGARKPLASSSTARKPWDGTAMTTTSAPSSASSSDAVPRSFSGRAKFGR